MSADKARKQPRRRAGPKRTTADDKVRLRTLDDLDKRTRAARDTADLREDLAADLGGWDEVSVMEGELITSAALIGAMIRHRAASYLEGERVDVGEFMSLTNSQRRLLSDLGYDRRMRNVTPGRGGVVRLYAPGLTDDEGRPIEYANGGWSPARAPANAQTVVSIPHNGRDPIPPREWKPGDPLPDTIEFIPPECGIRARQAPPREDDEG